MSVIDSVSGVSEVFRSLQTAANDLQRLKSLVNDFIISGGHSRDASNSIVSADFRQLRSHISGAHEEISLALDLVEELKRYTSL
jgi:hypothetical protein